MWAQGEDEQLAAQYFNNKEYDKAADLYEKLLRKNSSSMYYYDNYFTCLLELAKFKDAEKFLEKRIKREPENLFYQVDLGHVYFLAGNKKEAEKLFAALVNKAKHNVYVAEQLANAFNKRKYYDWGIETYKQTRNRQSDITLFAMEMAELYMIKGETGMMVAEFLNLADQKPWFEPQVKARLQTVLQKDEELQMLKIELIKRLQTSPTSEAISSLLIWTFIQLKDWQGAVMQLKALDKRLKEDGRRLMEFATICIQNNELVTARECYLYVQSLGKDKSYYYDARSGLLNTSMLVVRRKAIVDALELKQLENDFTVYIDDVGFNRFSAPAIKQLSELYLYYAGKQKEGIDLLLKLTEMPGLTPSFKAVCKLDLGDAYLVTGELWDADLMYKQVELDFKEDALGQEAKFRYARLCYYRGEFDWAQSQLDVLKQATTQLISNNAIELSLLILENTGLDSTEEALQLYAKAELLLFQKKYSEAAAALENLVLLFPGHSLQDDIYYSKARIMEGIGNYTEAEKYYTKVFTEFSFDILADNALWNLAQLYENVLKKPDKAKELYEKIMFQHTGSLYAPDARLRYRILRGDSNL